MAAQNIDTNRPAQKRKRARTGPPLSVEKENWVVEATNGILSNRSHGLMKGGQVLMMPVDEIILRAGGYRIYKDMLNDDQVKVCLAFKRVLVGGRTWDIKPADDSEEAKKIAEFVEWALRRINLSEIFREAMSAFEFGWSCGEINWETVKRDENIVLALKDIKHRDPQWVEINTDIHGNIKTFKQTEYGLGTELDKDKVWHFAHQPRFSNPYGVSDLRAAYRSYWAKKYVINFWNVYLERMGTPTTKMTYPIGASEELKNTLKQILTGLGSKSEILVPQGVEIDLIEAQRAGNPTYEKALQFHNNSIARAILMIGLLGAGGEEVTRGADSQSRLQLRTLFKMADEIAQSIVRSFSDQVIRQLVDFNFDHEGMYPKFIWQDYGEFEGIEIASAIQDLFVSGLITPDQEDINYARSVLGLPIRTENDDPDEPIQPQPLPPPGGATLPPSAPRDNQRASKGANKRKSDPGTGRSKRA